MDNWKEITEAEFKKNLDTTVLKVNEKILFFFGNHQEKEIIVETDKIKSIEHFVEQGQLGTGSYYSSSTIKYYKKEK